MGTNKQFSMRIYFETDMTATKYSVPKQHLFCLSTSHYGAVLTICSSEVGWHCTVTLSFGCHSAFETLEVPFLPHTFQLQYVLKSNAIMNWQLKYKSTSATMQFTLYYYRRVGRIHPPIFKKKKPLHKLTGVFLAFVVKWLTLPDIDSETLNFHRLDVAD